MSNRISRLKEKKIKKSDIVLLILLLVFLILFIVSLTKIIIYLNNAKKDAKAFESISEDVKVIEESSEEGTETEYKIDFKSLKEKNPDTVGYLKVNGTDISQVVVKGTNNDYYLWHNFEKQTNSAGWIFADYHNKFDGTDKNIIIYGHNMRNGTMFASLKNVLKKEWYENKDNRFITFITEEGEYTYEIFSVYEIEAEDYYMKTQFSDGDFYKYLNTMEKRSKYKFDVELTDEDQVLTLSTCGQSNLNRVILHAKRIDK